MWLVGGGGGEVVEAMYQLMWKYKYEVSQWNVCCVQRSPHGCAVPSFCFCKGEG